MGDYERRIWSRGNRRLDILHGLGDLALAGCIAIFMWGMVHTIRPAPAASQQAIPILSTTVLTLGSCLPIAVMAKALVDDHDERSIVVAFAADGTILNVFAPADGKTWTIVKIKSDGESCIVAFGQDWEQLSVAPSEPKA